MSKPFFIYSKLQMKRNIKRYKKKKPFSFAGSEGFYAKLFFYIPQRGGNIINTNNAEQLDYKKIYSTKYSISEITRICNMLKFLFCQNDSGYINFRHNAEIKSLNVKDIENKYRIYNLLNSFETKEDIFYSKNLYKKAYSKQGDAVEDNIQALRLIVIDLDFKTKFKNNKYMKNTDNLQFLEFLEKKHFDIDIPVPNLIEYSNQMRLIYIIKTVGATYKSKQFVKKIEKSFTEKLKYLGADYSRLTDGCRLLGSKNTKSDTRVKYFNFKKQLRSCNKIYNNKIYKLSELANYDESYVGRKEQQKQKENKSIKYKKKNNIKYIFNSNLSKEQQNQYSLCVCCLKDLETIQQYFNYSMSGRQEFMSFLYRNFAIQAKYSLEEAEKMTLDFYNKFKEHNTRENTLESRTRNVERKQYKFKMQSIIEQLSITEEEEKDMQLLFIMSNAEKERRQGIRNEAQNQQRKEKRAEAKKNRNLAFSNKINALKCEGYTQKQVAVELNKSVRTIKRWWNK